MRATALLCAVVSLSGCATWRIGQSAELERHGDAIYRVLVLTKTDRALELDVVRNEGGWVHGKLVRAWTIPTRSTDAAAMQETNEDPSTIATRFNWQPVPVLRSGESIDLALADIDFLRVYEPRTGQTVAAVAVGTILGLGAIAGIGFLILLATLPKCGRPLRVRGRRVITPIARGGCWSEPVKLAPVPDRVRSVLAEIWREEAQAEHAAIAAFSKLSLELLALGAPPDLVVRANRAAIQEVEHARLCFAVASAYSGETLGPAPLPEALAGDTADLFRIGREALLDGCMREGLAAEIARLGAERARDPEVVRVIRVQAKEEAQHAALGWLIVDWCLLRGGEPMRRTLLAALGEAALPRCDDLPEHGHLGRAEVEPLFNQMRARARERLASEATATPARAVQHSQMQPSIRN
jgi:hypothetical protein